MPQHPSVIFQYNITKDARSWVRWVFQGNPYLSRKKPVRHQNSLSRRLLAANSEEQAQEIAEECLASRKEEVAPLLNRFYSQIEPKWRRIEVPVLRKLEEITDRPLYCQRFTGYLVSSGHCSYFPPKRWFMVNLKTQTPITGIIHELLHMQFLTYYEDFCLRKGLSKENLYELNEALTAILNIEMKEYLDQPDKGYEKHFKLRKIITALWNRKRSLQEVLDELMKN